MDRSIHVCVIYWLILMMIAIEGNFVGKTPSLGHHSLSHAKVLRNFVGKTATLFYLCQMMVAYVLTYATVMAVSESNRYIVRTQRNYF